MEALLTSFVLCWIPEVLWTRNSDVPLNVTTHLHVHVGTLHMYFLLLERIDLDRTKLPHDRGDPIHEWVAGCDTEIFAGGGTSPNVCLINYS